jgi:hypothetical protein
MKILISESQYYRLFETTDLESGETADLESGEPTDLVSDKPTELVSTGINNYINYLCQKKEGYDNLPYCKLYEYWLDLKTSKDKKSLIDSVKALFTDVSSRLGNGLLPKIINLALESNSPVQYLKTIFLFINNKKFNNDETKKRLLDLTKSGVTISDDDLETVLTSARNKVYQEYENSFVGENKVFDKHSTYVNLDYRGNRLNEDSFFELVKIIKNDESKMEEISNKIIENIDGSVKNFIDDTTKMKADVKTNKSLVCNGKEIFSANTYFEIKKFSPNVDSHLSEFFSIFKQSDLISEKPEYLPTYNKLITTIYTKIKDRYTEFLKDIKSKIGGIILDNYTIIKIEDVDLYWSFKGQRKHEYRLSIRYQVKSGEKTAYKCNPSNNILEEVPIKPKSNERIGVII